MEELQAKESYAEFKEQLDTELKKTVESFVRIGYLLKIARDTEILHESGYPSVVEFAKAEYNLSKDQVSRFIAINDKYSVDGYSDKLQDKYEGYGVAKLAEMLTLPEAVADIIEPEMTRAEIQEIKREVKEEQAITDIEVMLEEKDINLEDMNMIQKFMYQYFYENRLDFIGMAAVIEGTLETTKQEIEETLNILAPTGIAIKKVRLAGIGKMLLSIKGAEQPLELVNVRLNEVEEFGWSSFLDDITQLYNSGASKEDWEMYYHEPFKKQKTEVAPVQPESVKTETESEKNETENKENDTDNQIQGKMNVNDYPELQPDVDEKVDSVTEKNAENIEKTESDTDSTGKIENVDNIAEIIEPKTQENVDFTLTEPDSKEEMLCMDEDEQEMLVKSKESKVLEMLNDAQNDITDTQLYYLAKARLQDAIRALEKLEKWKEWRH